MSQLFHISIGFLLFTISSWYATQALECYMCDSSEDVECATKPGQQINVEECVAHNDECVTSITAGFTRRGCLSRLYPNKYCAEPCNRCNTSLCNRHIFPTNRLRCYQCSGSSCIDVSSSPNLLLPCPIYHEKDRCYTNVINLSNTMRGCEHTNLPSGCPHVCLKCNYNGCNNELTVSEQTCLQCSHYRMSPNPACLRSQHPEPRNLGHTDGIGMAVDKCAVTNGTLTQCVNKVMYGHRENCFTYINDNTDVVQRGCSTTMGFYPTGVVEECAGNNCNSNCLNMHCNICNATEAAGGNCRIGRNLDVKKCAKRSVACYSCEQDTQLRRGCVDEDFMPAAHEACQLCRSTNGCNRWSARTCYHCNSLENDVCAAWSNETLVERSNCTHPHELCVSTIVNRMDLVYTVRGCASEVPECSDNDPYCVRCNGSLCNTHATKWQLEKLQLTYLDNNRNGNNNNKQRTTGSLLETLKRYFTF